MPSVSFYTLGCKLNFSESSHMAFQLEKQGFTRALFTAGADVYVINTCSVTDHADRKCKKVVREALRYNPNAFVAVVGCYAQLKPEEIATIPGVDVVLGAAEKFNLAEHLGNLTKAGGTATVLNKPIKEANTFVPAHSRGDRTRTFMKVQDGCDYFCSFCTIPLARGRSRSGLISQVLTQAEEVAKDDTKEIVLTGVNLGDFGSQTGESFFELIKALDRQAAVPRYRISSIEPNLLSNAIIEWVAASSRFMPHFHIPLQSGSNKMLRLMRRRYERELYASRVTHIKALMPHACIGVDVIVGHPGETEADFIESYQFLADIEVSYLHVFPYSERPNTTAVRMPETVPLKERGNRVDMLRMLSEKKQLEFYRQHLGSRRQVLWETDVQHGNMTGFTDNYIKCSQPYDPLMVNEITCCELTQLGTDRLMQVTTMLQPTHAPENT